MIIFSSKKYSYLYLPMVIALLLLTVLITIFNLKKTSSIMATVQEIEQKVDALQASVDTLQAALQTAFQALLDEIANNPNNSAAHKQ